MIEKLESNLELSKVQGNESALKKAKERGKSLARERMAFCTYCGGSWKRRFAPANRKRPPRVFLSVTGKSLIELPIDTYAP